MQSVYAFLDITKVADFRWKNADAERTQGVRHMIHVSWISFSYGIIVPSFIIVLGYAWQVLGTTFPPRREQPRRDPSRIRLTTKKVFHNTEFIPQHQNFSLITKYLLDHVIQVSKKMNLKFPGIEISSIENSP